MVFIKFNCQGSSILLKWDVGMKVKHQEKVKIYQN